MTRPYTLSRDEIACAQVVANIRQTTGAPGGKSNLPGPETSFEEHLWTHFLGACAEIAVSRWLNLCWTGCGKGALGAVDVGDMVEARTGRYDWLLVRPKDEPKFEYPFASVRVAVGPQMAFVTCHWRGWEFGRVVRDQGEPFQHNTNKPAWIMPIARLRPYIELQRWVEERRGELYGFQRQPAVAG